MAALQGRRDQALYQEPLRAAYWRAATTNLEMLAASSDLSGVAKLLLMRDQHRTAMSKQGSSRAGTGREEGGAPRAPQLEARAGAPSPVRPRGHRPL